MVHQVQDQAPNNFGTLVKRHFGALVSALGTSLEKAPFLRMILQAKVLNAQLFCISTSEHILVHVLDFRFDLKMIYFKVKIIIQLW